MHVDALRNGRPVHWESVCTIISGINDGYHHGTPITEPFGTTHTAGATPRLGLVLLVVFVAIAITDLREQRIAEPVLLALAAGGLALYGLIGWFGWWAVQCFEVLGPIFLFILYCVAMGALFLLATVIYLFYRRMSTEAGNSDNEALDCAMLPVPFHRTGLVGPGATSQRANVPRF